MRWRLPPMITDPLLLPPIRSPSNQPRCLTGTVRCSPFPDPMWTAVLPPTENPFMDDHLIYAGVLIVLALLGAGTTRCLGRTWAANSLVRRHSWLA